MQTRVLTSILQLAAWFNIVATCESDAVGQEPAPSKLEPAVSVQHYVSNDWHVAATDNSRIRHRGDLSQDDLQRLARHLEEKRAATGSTWLGSDFASTWSVECDVFLHRSDAQYEQHSRIPASTVGYGRRKVGRGKVWSRQLDLRWHSDPVRTFEVASHELTHVVLADRFCWHQIPHWADEGIAIAIETGTRRDRLKKTLRNAAETGRLFSLQELFSAKAYSQDRHMADLYYAQSASLVSYLIETGDHDQVIELADAMSRHGVGVDPAISRTTELSDALELEQRWQDWLVRAFERQSKLIAFDE